MRQIISAMVRGVQSFPRGQNTEGCILKLLIKSITCFNTDLMMNIQVLK